MKRAASAILLVILLTSMLCSAFKIMPVGAVGTIYIRADGSIDPPTAPIERDGGIYTLTGDITSEADGIVVERNNTVIDGNGLTLQGPGGGITIQGCENVAVQNIQIKAFQAGIQLQYSSRSEISANNITDGGYAIVLWYSSNNSVFGNNMLANTQWNIDLSYSSYNIISGNNITTSAPQYRSNAGILLYDSYNNSIIGNDITRMTAGIVIQSSYNSISENSIANCWNGIQIQRAYYNSVSRNRVTNSEHYGIFVTESLSNSIYHNSFWNNNNQVVVGISYGNEWDDGYPSGGNYWSDYADVDLYSGPNQNEPESDGIWDHPYVINVNNQDHYPLVNPAQPLIRVKGIDVSHHQGEITWPDVYAEDYRFAFAKASEGVGWSDPTFATNMANGNSAGLYLGAYHFARPDLGNSAVDEANYFITIAGEYLKKGFLRPALLLSTGSSLGKEALSAWVITWMETVKNETGIEPILQVNSDYANYYLNTSVASYDLWIIQWTYDPLGSPDTGIWDDWSFWQYSDLGAVPGISGNVFLDVFNGDLNKLRDAFMIHVDLSVKIDWISNSSPLEGEPVTINVTVTNIGTALSEKGYVTFEENVKYSNPIEPLFKTLTVSRADFDPLGPLESGKFSFVWYAVEVVNTEPSKRLSMTVFPRSADKDSNPNNNVVYPNLELVPTSGFTISRDAFSFSNSALNEPDYWAKLKCDYLVTSSHIYDAVSASAVTDLCYAANSAGGFCYGMARASILYYKYPQTKPFQKQTFYMKSDEVISDIREDQALEIYNALSDRVALEYSEYDLGAEYAKIVENIDNDQPVILRLTFDDNNVHAVTAFNYYALSSNLKNILVYDNNLPGTAYVVTFNLTDNTVIANCPKEFDSDYNNGNIARVFAYVPGTIQRTKSEINNFFRDLKSRLKQRIIIFDCPVNITITDQFDRVVSEIENQIPDAQFEYFVATDTKIFWLPSNLTYNIRLNATAYGNCTMSQITPTESDYRTDFSTVSFNLTAETSAIFQLGPYSANYTLKIDENSDGLIDRELAPDETILDFEYDVGILDVTPVKTVVCQGYDLPLNVTVTNYGAYTESFNVTFCANTTIMGTTELTLTNGSSITVAFTWNTTGFARGCYTVWAQVDPISGETNTADNTYTGEIATIAMQGDVNADGIIDIFDITTIALAFNSIPGDSNWNPVADINNDNIVDIFDIVVVALHFGETG